MSWTVIEADGNGVRETRRGGTLTGEAERTEPKRKDAMPITDITLKDIWIGLHKQPVKRVQQLPEPEPKPKLITWRLCVRVKPWEVDERTLYVKWYRSGDIPEDWYPIEAQSQPVETVKQLSEGQQP